MAVVGFVRVRSVNSRALWGSSGSFVCFWSIPAFPGGHWVRSCALGSFPGVVSGNCGPFPCALSDRSVRSVGSRTP